MSRGVAALEVDALGLVHEAYGPTPGAAVLRELAGRLLEAGGSTPLGRWRPNVFVWVLDAVDPGAALGELSNAVLARLQAPFEVGKVHLRLTVRMGLAASRPEPPAPPDPIPEVLPAAMRALRVAATSGAETPVWYSDAMDPQHPSVARLGAELGRAVVHDELRLHFQPIVDLSDDSVSGVEALARWERPGSGLLEPASFIDAAERTGQVVALGAWVTHAACLHAVELAATRPSPITVSINVSARQLADPGLVAMIVATLRRTRCPPSALTVEITETALMVDLEDAATTLATIKELGVGLDLDDFGTGYSSLLYLKHFPVDRIKIDQSFVAGLGTSHADTSIVASTIALAHAVGIRAVAEGVETADQLRLLRDMGCDYAQGYLVSRPLDAPGLGRWLSTCDAHLATISMRTSAADDGGDEPTPARRRAAAADRRDAEADRRDLAADRRDARADGRDAAADLRDARADERGDSCRT